MPGPNNEDLRKQRPDRRRWPSGPLDALFTPGRRRRDRRSAPGASSGSRFFDRHGLATGIGVVLLLVLTIVDGTITMVLLGMHCEEANPLMARLIDHGLLPFILGKYAMTAAGLPVILIFKRHRMFGTSFRVGYLLPIFIGMYLTLLGYQIQLLRTPLPTPGLSSTGVGVVVRARVNLSAVEASKAIPGRFEDL
ncbi:hypothetical protein BH23PLA1_BH23PLA1_00900 [soil metagenome]